MGVETGIILNYMQDLDDLKKMWTESGEIDQKKISIHIEYIISKIPFPDIQNNIRKEKARLEKKYEEEDDPNGSLRASFAAVTGVMAFIFEKFELVHEDIIGGATSRQYRDAMVEVPDMPKEHVDEMPRSEQQLKISG